MHEDQYSIVATRRQSYDSMLWRAPTLSVAAQAFMIAVANKPEFAGWPSIAIYTAACLVGLAAWHLFATLRQFEISDSRLLEKYERENEGKGFEVIHVPLRQRDPQATAFCLKVRAFHVWSAVLGIFVVLTSGLACFEAASLLETGGSMQATPDAGAGQPTQHQGQGPGT